MSYETIRRKTEELRLRTRRAQLRGMAVPLLAVVFAGWTMTKIQGGPVVGSVFALAVAWSLAGQYFLNKGMWSAAPHTDEGPRPGLVNYRREVERRRQLAGGFLMWSLGPVVLALAAFLGPLLNLGIQHGMLPQMIPFLGLLVIWAVGVFVLWMKERRGLGRELQELNELEAGIR